MSGDIEEFLRRAAERRKNSGQNQSPPARPEPPRQEMIRREPPMRSVPEPLEILDIPDYSVVDDQSNQTESDPYKTSSTPYSSSDRSLGSARESSRLLSSGVSSEDISSHADRLGSDLIEHRDDAQEMIKQHLGEAVPTRDFEEEKDSAFVTGLMKMIQSPDSVAQAVIMKEILQRPDFDKF